MKASLRFLSHLISTVFHPLMMPTYGFVIYMLASPYLFANYWTPLQTTQPIFGMDLKPRLFDVELIKVFMFTYFFPALGVLLMIGLKMVPDVDVKDRSKRIGPYIVSGFFYILAFVYYQRSFEWPVFQAILLGSCIAIFSGFLINLLFLKISAHASGVGGLVAFSMIMMPMVYLDISWIFVASLVVAGLVGSARMYLNIHTPRELLSGYAVGYLSQWIAFLIIV